MKVKVVFYSMHSHTYRLAEAIAKGAGEVQGIEGELFQVQELVPAEILETSGDRKVRDVFSHIPFSKPVDMANADTLIFVTPTHFGNICVQRMS